MTAKIVDHAHVAVTTATVAATNALIDYHRLGGVAALPSSGLGKSATPSCWGGLGKSAMSFRLGGLGKTPLQSTTPSGLGGLGKSPNPLAAAMQCNRGADASLASPQAEAPSPGPSTQQGVLFFSIVSWLVASYCVLCEHKMRDSVIIIF